MATICLPQKTREIHNHHMDSTIWNEFRYRQGDVVIGTYAKAGTTWTQQIVGQMLHGPDPLLNVSELSPWVDMRIPPKAVKLPQLDAQKGRRFLKTHLPADALVFSSKAKYLYIARDGRDVVWSLYNHHARANDLFYAALNDTPGRVGPPIERPTSDICQYFRDWLDGDGYPFWSFWENISSWWLVRDLPNVKLLHFADLRRDLPGMMREIADFLEVDVAEPDWPEIQRYCSFDWMKAHAETVVPLGGAIWNGGAQTFIHKGTNGRWQDVLPAKDSAAYEARARSELGDECATWLAQR